MSFYNILPGIASVLNVFGLNIYLRNSKTPDRCDWADDCESLRSDWESIGKDMLSAAHFNNIAFSGPIPPPGFLKEYEEILPNAADRILTMAEKQGEH